MSCDFCGARDNYVGGERKERYTGKLTGVVLVRQAVPST